MFVKVFAVGVLRCLNYFVWRLKNKSFLLYGCKNNFFVGALEKTKKPGKVQGALYYKGA